MIFAMLISGLVLYGVIHAVVRLPGNELRKRAMSANPMQGKTKTALIDQIGPPTAITQLGGGRSLVQWQASGYHFALAFGPDDICEGVTHEASV